jgi:hypothetical protein
VQQSTKDLQKKGKGTMKVAITLKQTDTQTCLIAVHVEQLLDVLQTEYALIRARWLIAIRGGLQKRAQHTSTLEPISRRQ